MYPAISNRDDDDDSLPSLVDVDVRVGVVDADMVCFVEVDSSEMAGKSKKILAGHHTRNHRSSKQKQIQ